MKVQHGAQSLASALEPIHLRCHNSGRPADGAGLAESACLHLPNPGNPAATAADQKLPVPGGVPPGEELALM